MIQSMLMSAALVIPIDLNLVANAWRSINDGVMGGVSSGGMKQIEKGLSFTGELSLENNGGFSSARRMVTQDLSGVTRVRLEVRGDGREYQFRIRQNSRFDGVAWRATFLTGDEWQAIELALDDFIPVYRGTTIAQAGPVIASEIQQIGFLLADRKAGGFELQIRRIDFIGMREEVTHGRI